MTHPAIPRPVAAALALCVATLGRATAATVTVTDCAADPHIVVNPGLDSTRIEVGSDDLVVACDLVPLGTTSRVVLSGRNLTIQGPEGRVSAFGANKAIDISAGGTFAAVDAVIESTNGNARADILAAGDITFTGTQVTVGTAVSGGDLLTIACSQSTPACKITATSSTFKSRLMKITAVGDVSFAQSKIITNGPFDLITVASIAGNVDLGAIACGGTCGGSACPGNTVTTGNEGGFHVSAFGSVDLSSANVLVAEEIVVTSGVGEGRASVPAGIDLRGASLRNDFGKPGQITILADEGQASIDITDAILIDDGDDVASLNGRDTLPHTGFDNVVGTPATDG